MIGGRHRYIMTRLFFLRSVYTIDRRASVFMFVSALALPAAGHVPNRLPTIFFFSSRANYTVLYSRSLWKRVKSATRGILSRLESTEVIFVFGRGSLRRYPWPCCRPERDTRSKFSTNRRLGRAPHTKSWGRWKMQDMTMLDMKMQDSLCIGVNTKDESVSGLLCTHFIFFHSNFI